jgi:hypothetical protein
VLRRCRTDRTGFETVDPCTASEECQTEPPACVALRDFADALHGFTILMPCVMDHAEPHTCYSKTGTCPTNADPVLNGALGTNQVLTFGGTAGVMYDVTVRVQGQVEAKVYTDGNDQANTSPLPADGFYEGGGPHLSVAAEYNTYAMRVSSPAQDYFFNSIGIDGDNRVRRSTFDIDFTATIPIEGGATLRMIAADPNCLATKNCADPETSVCTPHNFSNLSAEIAGDIGSQPYNGQFVGFLVQSVTRAP